MSSLSRELVFLILQFLEEEKFKDTAHKLEQETGLYFNMKHFEELVTSGDWENVEKYLTGFTKVEDNRYSMKIFFEIRKQKYLEALDKKDHATAVEVLSKDLKVFSNFNEDLYKELTLLLTLPNFRENEQLARYGEMKSARGMMLTELKKLIEANPLFREKLQFPTLRNSRLRTLINQSLNWQHQLCKYPKPNPDIKTLFMDHSCGKANGALAPSPVTNQLPASVPKLGAFQPLNAHVPETPPLSASLGGWMVSSSSVPHQSISEGPLGIAAPHNADSEHVVKRQRPSGISEEANNLPVNILPVTYPGQSHARNIYSSDDLPKTVLANLNLGSVVKSLDFHPVRQTLLLVGTYTGDISIWEVARRERLAARRFKVWNLEPCSVVLQAALANESTTSANRVVWSPDGALLGIAYSKHIVHIHSYVGGDDFRDHSEIEAHVGSVNDLAFSKPDKQLYIITCGEDRTIKVWDASTGEKQFTFEGHEAPVYSVCPHHKENIQFIFSTAINGKIKAWLYDDMGSRVDYDAPGHSCTRMAYSTDGSRLFSCGTNKEGDSYLVEWYESEGAIKRTYHGLGKLSMGVVQFDTTRNRFLAVGDEFVIKFWDMDNSSLLTTTDAEGGLPASPCIRFNKEGIFLAVSTNENGIKILGNAEGIRLAGSTENRTLDDSKFASGTMGKVPIVGTYGASSSAAGTSICLPDRSILTTPLVGLNGESRTVIDLKSRITDELEKSKIWKLTEISEPSQLRSLKLPDALSVRIVRLMYMNSGNAILALAYNAVHNLWKWQRNEHNLTGKATTNMPPQMWQPCSGVLMTNDISETNPENAFPCFALSKNDSYVMSASGGKVSLFNLMSFKIMTTFMPPPPSATSLAFHPKDNNVLAVGMEDSSIQIYNVRFNEVKSTLKGHQKRVTGLAFSNDSSVLVSSGADAQLCVWSMEGWEKIASKSLQIPLGRAASPLAHTHIQFHQDQKRLLVVHETQLAIFEAPKLECLKQFVPREVSGSITDATYSCDSEMIFASFQDGSVSVLTSSTLRLRCRISPTAYIPSNPSKSVYPLVIAAHPSEPNQFALGLTDGGVYVLEPPESEDKWGNSPPQENGASPSNAGAANSEQPSK